MEVKDYFACHEFQFTRKKLDVNKGCRCFDKDFKMNIAC